MYGIDTDTAASSLPSPDAAGTAGYFQSADPALGKSATTVSPDWLNAVQGEILAVVDGAGDTPDKTDNSQLFAGCKNVLGQLIIRGGLAARRPHASETLAIPMLDGDMLPAGLDGSIFRLTTAPAASWVMTIKQNDTEAGTITVAKGATTGTFDLDDDVSFTDAGTLALICPATQDDAARGISFALVGSYS